jgi:hypothetical protein
VFAHGQSVTTFLRTVIPLYLLFEHDLFGKPAATFPDHASVGEIEIVTISLYEASVGVFVPYLGNLSDLLDRASAYAKARNIDPVVLSQHVQSDATGGGGQPSRRGGLCTTGRPSAAHIRG